MSGLGAAERDALFRDCALAIDAAGPDADRLFLARLALLLMEALGDAPRCRQALAAASLPAAGHRERETGDAG